MHQAKLLHPPAQKDPDIDLIEKFTLKVALEQDAITKRVESGNVRAGFEAGQIMAYAALHFSSSLVREGQRQNVFRLKPAHIRSEERRVGKECRSRWSRHHEKKKYYA